MEIFAHIERDMGKNLCNCLKMSDKKNKNFCRNYLAMSQNCSNFVS